MCFYQGETFVSVAGAYFSISLGDENHAGDSPMFFRRGFDGKSKSTDSPHGSSWIPPSRGIENHEREEWGPGMENEAPRGHFFYQFPGPPRLNIFGPAPPRHVFFSDLVPAPPRPRVSFEGPALCIYKVSAPFSILGGGIVSIVVSQV